MAHPQAVDLGSLRSVVDPFWVGEVVTFHVGRQIPSSRGWSLSWYTSILARVCQQPVGYPSAVDRALRLQSVGRRPLAGKKAPADSTRYIIEGILNAQTAPGARIGSTNIS